MLLSPDHLRVVLPDEAAILPLAAVLALSLPRCAFVALMGDLGAGKTTFVKAVAAAAGIDPSEVVSPTFGLIHIHKRAPHATNDPGQRLVHADLYRLNGVTDLDEIGWEDAISPSGWVFVEWAQRIANHLPAERLDIHFDIDSETGRTLSFTSYSCDYRVLMQRLREGRSERAIAQ